MSNKMYRQQLSYLYKWIKETKRKPILIRGARQVGKSTLVHLLAEQSQLELVELNFERNPELVGLFKSNDPQKICQLISLQTGKTIQNNTTLLFLDEIQKATEAIVALRYFYEELPQLHVICAGSLLEFTLAEGGFPMPVGRIEYLHLGPMSFNEFLIALNEKLLADYICEFEIDDEMELSIHLKIIDFLKIYFVVGGMPESVKAYIEDKTYQKSEQVKQSILSTYRDDFGKYALISHHELIRKLFNKLPAILGNKFKYSQISSEIKSSTIATALNQLCLARVASKIHHSSANGIPLGAEQNDRFFKVLFLDIGLVSTNLGLNYLNLMDETELDFVNKGSLAEQFIGQHLLYSMPFYQEPMLHYWAREKKSSSAEVDYVISFGQKIIPIEVKAGKTGQMKSMHLFITEKQSSLGVRFNSEPPTQMEVTNKLSDGSSIQYQFLSLPLYMVDQLERLIKN
jgi:uncharacterized protein